MSTRLVEVELRVEDVERSRRFYRDLIGIDVGELETHGNDAEPHAHATWGEWASTSPTLLMLNIYPARQVARTAARIGFVVPDVEAIHRRLGEAGIAAISGPDDQPWGRTATYLDPDGNIVSLTQAPR